MLDAVAYSVTDTCRGMFSYSHMPWHIQLLTHAVACSVTHAVACSVLSSLSMPELCQIFSDSMMQSMNFLYLIFLMIIPDNDDGNYWCMTHSNVIFDILSNYSVDLRIIHTDIKTISAIVDLSQLSLRSMNNLLFNDW